jgi:hypothetical protein
MVATGGAGSGCWQIADRVVGRAASPLAARCARDVLAGHNPDRIYCIVCSLQAVAGGWGGRGAGRAVELELESHWSATCDIQQKRQGVLLARPIRA